MIEAYSLDSMNCRKKKIFGHVGNGFQLYEIIHQEKLLVAQSNMLVRETNLSMELHCFKLRPDLHISAPDC